MEVTTVSPSPASPTEGDDVCEIDVTNVAIHSVTLLISLCGLAGNGAVLCLLSMKHHNTYVFNLAFADFLFMLFTVLSTLLFLVEEVSCSPIVSLLYKSFLFQLSVVLCYWVMFCLMFSYDVVNIYMICVPCMTCCSCGVPERLVWSVRAVQYWAFFALFTVSPAVTHLCPSDQQGHCWAALISMYAIILLLFVAPMVISTRIYFIKAKMGSKKLKPKRCIIVLSLIVLFILLLSLGNFLQQLGYTKVSTQVFFLLNCTHSSIKPFIYFLAGRCWRPCDLSSLRLSLRRVFDEQKEKPAPSNDAPMDTGV